MARRFNAFAAAIAALWSAGCTSAAGGDAGMADGAAVDAPLADTAVAADTAFTDTAVADNAFTDTAVGDAAIADTAAVDTAIADATDADTAIADAAIADTTAGVGQPCSANGQAGTCGWASECQGTPIPGFCPGPAAVQCCVAKTAVCDPKAAPLPNGALTPGAGSAGCPAGMAKVEAFCIDRWEAHLQVQTAKGDFAPWSPYVNPGSQVVRAVTAAGSVPQGHVSGVQASAACALAGKRLCKDSEWLRACRGPSAWSYPYGSTLALGTCNDHRSLHPAVELYGTAASWIYSKLDNACLNQLPNSLAKTGSFPGCVSAEGVFDLVGNLHEWTADPAGTFRGGFYVDTKLNGPGCLYATTAHTLGHWDYSTGFRCCAELL